MKYFDWLIDWLIVMFDMFDGASTGFELSSEGGW